MVPTPRFARMALGIVALAVAGGAIAHPKLLSTLPADHSTGPSPKTVVVGFSESLLPKFSGAEIAMTAMPGMAQGQPMTIASVAAVASDGKTLVVTPSQPLVAGTYQVNWHVVATDTHPAKGSITFDVK